MTTPAPDIESVTTGEIIEVAQKAMAENARLREALRVIADDCKGCAADEITKLDLGERAAWKAVERIARAALTKEQP